MNNFQKINQNVFRYHNSDPIRYSQFPRFQSRFYRWNLLTDEKYEMKLIKLLHAIYLYIIVNIRHWFIEIHAFILCNFICEVFCEFTNVCLLSVKNINRMKIIYYYEFTYFLFIFSNGCIFGLKITELYWETLTKTYKKVFVKTNICD